MNHNLIIWQRWLDFLNVTHLLLFEISWLTQFIVAQKTWYSESTLEYFFSFHHNNFIVKINLRYSLDINWQRRSVSISRNSSSPVRESSPSDTLELTITPATNSTNGSSNQEEKVFEVNDPPATREKLEWTNVKAMSLQTYYDRKSQYKFTWKLKYK